MKFLADIYFIVDEQKCIKKKKKIVFTKNDILMDCKVFNKGFKIILISHRFLLIYKVSPEKYNFMN